MGAKISHDSEILAGIPSGVWADAWATRQEEKGRSFSGQDIIEAAPKPPKRAKDWAKKVADKIVELNRGRSLENLYEIAQKLGYRKDKENFGFHLGMQTVGHGLSWTDDADYKLIKEFEGKSGGHEPIQLPHDEFYY